MTTSTLLPATGFVRLKTIIGDPEAMPPVPPVFPVSCRSWWQGVKDGRYPQPVKLGPRTTAWRVEDIRALLNRMAASAPHCSIARSIEAVEVCNGR